MLKITEPAYSLPKVYALLGVHVLSSGSTEPMLIRGVEVGSGKRGQYVVKFMKAPRMNPQAACREIFAEELTKILLP